MPRKYKNKSIPQAFTQVLVFLLFLRPIIHDITDPDTMFYIKRDTGKICYMILPEGIKEDVYEGLERMSVKYGVSMVVIDGVNWNDDLTPWPAEGVFKKAKPFKGQAASFLDRLTKVMIPEIEKEMEVEATERTILGVSLSGLFAVWAAFNTDAFTNVISISGSLWYDGFVDWMNENTLSPQVQKVCMLLGEKEKSAKDRRMATVEERTEAAARIMEAKTNAGVCFELVEGTHFSPVMPRLERAFDLIWKSDDVCR